MPPVRYLIPNSITALSLSLGLGSVVMSVQGQYHLAAWFILWGVLLDKVDGTMARLFKATSDFGVQFDSFADFVVFGIAPAALMYFHLVRVEVTNAWWPAVAAAFYVVALAVRLARFNVTTTSADTVFLGIPGTLMGAIVATSFLTWEKYALPRELLHYAPVFLVAAAILMVSNIRLPKLKVRKNQLVNLFQFANVAAAYILGPLMLLPEYLLGMALTYLVVGVVFCQLRPDDVLPAPMDSPTNKLGVT